jgi:hypothetical protein
MKVMLPYFLLTPFAKKLKEIFSINRAASMVSEKNVTATYAYNTQLAGGATNNSIQNINDAKQCDASFSFIPTALNLSVRH